MTLQDEGCFASCQYHVIAVYDLRCRASEDTLYLPGAAPQNLRQFCRRVAADAAADLATLRVLDTHHLAHGEGPLAGGDPRRQQAAVLQRDGRHGTIVYDDRTLRG